MKTCGETNMKHGKQQPLPPEEATQELRYIAQEGFDIYWPPRLKRKIKRLDLIIGDVWNACRFGEISKQGTTSTLRGFFKYEVCWGLPNPTGKSVTVVVIMNPNKNQFKVCDDRTP